MRYQSYFNTAVSLIRSYNGTMPLVHFLKQYFAQHKKHGSNDRKLISHLCYTYFRLGHACNELAQEERMRIALFLCSDEAGLWSTLYSEYWLASWNTSLPARIDFIRSQFPSFSLNAVLPWRDAMSKPVDPALFIQSHFIQPELFLRVRPGYEQTVRQKLQTAGIGFQQRTESCLALPNSSKIDSILSVNKEVLVQDYSSQQIASLFEHISGKLPASPAIWDCCAASGGKSILAADVFCTASLTVSDIRSSILHNLEQRFAEGGIRKYRSFVADLSKEDTRRPSGNFDLVICDVPCSGSGTWGRTPEQMYFFEKDKIAGYAALQQKIVQQVMQYCKTGGYLLYITCSVFKQENEDQVQSIIASGKYELVKMESLNGYDKKADSMFAALLRKQGNE